MEKFNSYKKDDKNYLDNLNQYSNPKEYFKVIVDLIKRKFGDKPISLCDTGCASGAFLYYAMQHLNLREMLGIDISPKLIAQAKEKIPNAHFLINSLLDTSLSEDKKFEVVVCLGTLSIFDEITEALKNLYSLLASKGLLIIYDLVNEFPIDVIMRFKDVGNNSNVWQSGFNVRSRMTYERQLKKINSKAAIKFTNFLMPFKLPKNENVLRAWTIKTENNDYQLQVGTGQLLNFSIIEFQK